MQLHPREKFIVTRQLQNPYITDTFYVRAVIRNSRTDATIATLDLVDQTGQRFTKEWLVPADVSGLGFPISIVTSVYTDSGYTTKSQNYGDEENTYIVQERYIFNPNYPVGADIDYKRIKKMIDDAISKILIPELEPKTVTVVKEVKVPDVRVVETVKMVDLGPVLSAVKEVGKKVDDKEIPEQKEVDLLPVIQKLGNLSQAIDSEFTRIEKAIRSMGAKYQVKQSLKQIIESLEDDSETEIENVKKSDDRVIRLMKK